MKNYKLEGILATTIPLAEAVFYENSALHTTAERVMGIAEPIINNAEITPYIGNFPESFAIPAISGFLGDYIETQGIQRGNKLLEKVGKYCPEISTATISTYFTLGETVLPQILPGTADIRDIPAVLISAFAGYVLAKLGRKSGFNEKVYEMAKEQTQQQRVNLKK